MDRQRIDMIYATEQEIREKVKRVDVKYADGETSFYDVGDWLVFRGGIIKNLYAKGLCTIRFRKK